MRGRHDTRIGATTAICIARGKGGTGNTMRRRRFKVTIWILSKLCRTFFYDSTISTTNRNGGKIMKEALLYESLDGNRVRCNLCNHRCKIQEGKRGICSVRENQDGKLYSLVYGKIIAEHIDPIEKKPLFNFLPGSRAFSIGTVGCNFHCNHFV